MRAHDHCAVGSEQRDLGLLQVRDPLQQFGRERQAVAGDHVRGIADLAFDALL